MCSYISAIRAILKDEGVEMDEDVYLLSSLTKACKLRNGQVHTRLPIKKGLLGMILRETEFLFMSKGQPFLAALYTAHFSTAYFGLFRVGELTKGDHPVLARDVHIGSNKRKILFILRTSKTHGRGNKLQQIKITSNSSSQWKCNLDIESQQLTCPYQHLRNYLTLCGPYKVLEETFFVFSDGLAVALKHMHSCLKMVLTRLGFDASLYTVHSLRTGRSHDLYSLGLSVETIKKIGRWRSNAVFRYLR